MLDFLIVLICLIFNAFFSAYEMAFVTVSKEEIEGIEEHNHTHKKLLVFKRRPERTLSVIQVGITLVGAIAAAVGGTGAVESLEPYIISRFGLSGTLAEAISVAIVIIPLTYFSVVFGELVPKTIALKHPVRVISFGTRILSVFDKILSPVVSVLEISTNYLLKLLRLDKADEDESMGQTIEIGNLPDYHQQFVRNLISIKGRKVQRVMIPWIKVSLVDFKDSEEEIRTKIFSVPFSRFPVMDGDVLVGVLHKKHIQSIELTNQMTWQGLLHPAIKVNQDDRILEAFLKMQHQQIPLAIVKDGDHFVGLITIEDIVEEIVGDINDRADYSITSKLLSNRSKISF